MTTETLGRRNFFKVLTGGVATLASPGITFAQDADPLADYLASISEEKASSEDSIIHHPRYFDPVDLDGFQRYFPMYKAGEISYQIPWLLTFIIHKEETTYSRDPNTYSRNYAGAMQRSVSWSMSGVNNAAKDWTFLKDLPQRYPDDWKEILWGTKYLRDLAGSSDESRILGSLNGYSADGPANRRAARYKLLKPLFIPDSP